MFVLRERSGRSRRKRGMRSAVRFHRYLENPMLKLYVNCGNQVGVRGILIDVPKTFFSGAEKQQHNTRMGQLSVFGEGCNSKRKNVEVSAYFQITSS